MLLLWPSVKSWAVCGTQAATALSPDVLAEIDKDTHRTFPGHPR